MNRTVFFVPACGLGSRVIDRGPKPFLVLADEATAAINRVMAQAPEGMPVEIMLPARLGCVPLHRAATVYFLDKQTSGQAETIRQWVYRCNDEYEWVLLSNCDNVIDGMTIRQGFEFIRTHRECDGVVFTFTPKDMRDQRFSYVHKLEGTLITDVTEKELVSPYACTGVYLLRISQLMARLEAQDSYLSEALNRMEQLHMMQCKHYVAWNDIRQIDEVERGETQYVT